MCGTYPHGIWVNCFTPNIPEGHCTYLLPFLWTIRPHLHEQLQSTSCYSLNKYGWEMKGASDPTSEKYLWTHDILPLSP